MGNNISKTIYNLPDNLYEMTIYSFDAKLNKTSNYENKMNALFDFIFNEKYDILCLQGLNNPRSFSQIKDKLDNYNSKCDDPDNEFYNCSKLLYFPDNNDGDSDTINQSVSIDQDEVIFDNLIISKHPMFSMTTIKIPSHICTKNNAFCAINIIIYGNMISVYNIALQEDYLGVSNNKIRAFQLNLLNDAITMNQENLDSEHIKKCTNKSIHIICIQSNIFEFKNDDINNEYKQMINALQCKDTFKYVQTIKNNKNNKNMIPRTNYIFLSLINDDIYTHDSDIKSNKLAIINSIQKTNMKLFDELPILAQFILVKNNTNTSSEPFADSDDDDIEKTEQILD